MIKAISVLMLVQAAAAVPSASPPRPPEAFKPVSPELISRADALAVAEASLRACEALKETVAVFVTDADGNLRAAMTSDNLNPIGLRSVTGKTAAVLAFKASTRDLEARLKTDPAFAEQYGKDPRYFYHPGAVPLYRDGKFVAVLALGGGHDKDEGCALQGLKVLPWARTTP